MKDMEVSDSSDVLKTIRDVAQERWGDKWLPEIVKAYVTIAQSKGDEKATPVSRRPQLERAFERGSCNLDTALMLAASVECNFQLTCKTVVGTF